MAAVVQEGFELRGQETPLRVLIRDVWRSRDLLRILAKKDFFVKYRRASFGLIWAVGLPLVQATVLSIVLTRIVRFPTRIDFPVFVFSGILPWSQFSGSIASATNSIVDGSSLATKIYFPRAVLPLVVVRSNLYGFIPGLALLVLMALLFGVSLGPSLLLLIPGTLLLILLASSFALVLSALQVYFRDVRHVVAAIMLPWFWGSGVFYPLERLGDLARWIELNPAVGVLQLFRASLGAAGTGWERSVFISVGWSAALLVAAGFLHRKYDRVFVDLL